MGNGRANGAKSLITILRKALDEPLTLNNSQTGKPENKLTSEWLIAVTVREALRGDKTHMREIWERIRKEMLK